MNLNNFFSNAFTLFLVASAAFMVSVTVCQWNEDRASTVEVAGHELNIVNQGLVCPQQNPDDCYDAWIVMGAVNDAMASAVANTISQEGIELPFCFTSSGGSISSAHTIINTMRNANAKACLGDTYVVNNRVFTMSTTDINGKTTEGNLCMSACGIIFAGAKERVVFGEALIGVHNGRHVLDFCWCQLPLSNPETPLKSESYDAIIASMDNESDANRLRQLRLISEKVNNEDMMFLSADQIESLTLVTQMVYPRNLNENAINSDS